MSKKAAKKMPNERSAYFVTVTDVNGNAMWKGVVDDSSIVFSPEGTEHKSVTIVASSLASYLKRKIEAKK